MQSVIIGKELMDADSLGGIRDLQLDSTIDIIQRCWAYLMTDSFHSITS